MVSTIVGPAPNGVGKANVEAFFWFPFVQAAVYNAVNGITGKYELYKWNAKAPKGASPKPRRRRRRTGSCWSTSAAGTS